MSNEKSNAENERTDCKPGKIVRTVHLTGRIIHGIHLLAERRRQATGTDVDENTIIDELLVAALNSLSASRPLEVEDGSESSMVVHVINLEPATDVLIRNLSLVLGAPKNNIIRRLLLRSLKAHPDASKVFQDD